MVQYNAALIMNGQLKNGKKLESLVDKRWSGKLFSFTK